MKLVSACLIGVNCRYDGKSKVYNAKGEDVTENFIKGAFEVLRLILDHHLMRSKKGEQWLDSVSSLSGRKVVCAADFMGRCRRLLEAERVLWYKKVPVPEGWHEAYACGEADTKPYQRFSEATLELCL